MVITLAASCALFQTLTAQEVADPIRIALTPSLDGKIEPGEWEPFTRDGGTFFQWEPGKVYWAAQARQGNDVVLSYDANGDGWLTGNDNVEIRARVKDGNVVTTVRRLDASDPNNPRWIDGSIAPEAISVSALMTNDLWQIEGQLDVGSGLPEPKEGRKAAVRVDIVPSNADFGPAYVPRPMTPVRFAFDSSSKLFPGLTWQPKFLTRLFSKEDELTIRYEFHAAPECPLLKGISVQGDGRAAGFAAFDSPFPALDRSRNAKVTYKSPLSNVKGYGWKVVKTTVIAFDGTPCTLRSSLQIADVLTMSANLPESV